MDLSEHRIAFGPIPSRRLGRSLGVNNIPAKVCSYACRYCQVGTTTEHSVEPRAFFDSGQIRAAVVAHLGRIRAAGQDADHLSFVPDGEPTLDSGLGESIAALRELGVPIAVITNGSLLWREDVRARLSAADLVSVKVDSVCEDVWRRVNGPHRDLDLKVILQGVREFATAAARGRSPPRSPACCSRCSWATDSWGYCCSDLRPTREGLRRHVISSMISAYIAGCVVAYPSCDV